MIAQRTAAGRTNAIVLIAVVRTQVAGATERLGAVGSVELSGKLGNSCLCGKRKQDLFGKSAPIYRNFTTTNYDPGGQQIPVPVERVAGKENYVRQFADFECAEVLRSLDEGRGVRSHQLDDVLRREHQVQRAQF